MFTLWHLLPDMRKWFPSPCWDTKVEESSTKGGISVVGLPVTRKKCSTGGSKGKHNSGSQNLITNIWITWQTLTFARVLEKEWREEAITLWNCEEEHELYPNIQPLYLQDVWEQQYWKDFDKHHKDISFIGVQ